jgi:phosphoribosylglycinamide formyltransferase-1
LFRPRLPALKSSGAALSARLVVLVSGSGTNLAALLEATTAPAYGATVVAVGSDRDGAEGLVRAELAGIPTFVLRLSDFSDREAWDSAYAEEVARHEPDLVVCAGFMKLFGETFLTRLAGKVVNTHPALLPSFPGMHGARDALAHGVKVTGCTLFVIDRGVDSGPIIAQRAVEVLDSDDEDTLHERIKSAERAMLVDTIGRMAREGWHFTDRKVTIG